MAIRDAADHFARVCPMDDADLPALLFSRMELLMEVLETTRWCERCAARIMTIDDEIHDADARRLAREVHAFERTRAMSPEAAADFIASEMGRENRGRFERRIVAR